MPSAQVAPNSSGVPSRLAGTAALFRLPPVHWSEWVAAAAPVQVLLLGWSMVVWVAVAMPVQVVVATKSTARGARPARSRQRAYAFQQSRELFQHSAMDDVEPQRRRPLGQMDVADRAHDGSM